MVIELRVLQFWSEILLVTSNRICAAPSFDFEITPIIFSREDWEPPPPSPPTNYVCMISAKTCTPLSSITIIYSLKIIPIYYPDPQIASDFCTVFFSEVYTLKAQENFPKKHYCFFEWEFCKFPFTKTLLENPNT